ncbi:hypothetical protein SPV1_03853 [Mariprofundus ferrooxydans PV-1]|uniref:Uncharacterized protein n=1 Tax=Mariprofundus ferrooxydans PV-1 TaxID=314345 RepID=Q0F3M0_9PROT|nr:hypothetical protein SPV1_03853 [Mariprofundus ferrooxydans PV-1]
MEWKLLLFMLPFAAFCWWAGFFATKRYRQAKNRANEQ